MVVERWKGKRGGGRWKGKGGRKVGVSVNIKKKK